MGRKRREVDTTTYSGRLAVRVRELREAKRLTVEELAVKVGVSTSGFYAWECGDREIAMDRLPRLAKALGCKTVGDLMPDR